MKQLFLWTLLVAVSTVASQAAFINQIELDTTILKNSFAGPFSLAFQLGGGSEAGNNTAILNGFNFGTGLAGGFPILVGGATGDLTTGVTITDTDTDNFFIEGVTFGDILRFNLTLTTNVDAGGTPDDFIWSILDSTDTPILTTSSSPLSPLLAITLDSSNPAIATFGSADFSSLFLAPTATVVSGVPEPSTGLLSAAALSCMLLFLHKRAV